MSPALVTKYLDAAKEVASHAVFVPGGIEWSDHATRRDWTDERLDELRAFYRQFTTTGGGQKVNLQGIRFDTNQGGLLPVEAYLDTMLRSRDALRKGDATIEAVAAKRKLSSKYLARLWKTLEAPPSKTGSFLLDRLRADWRAANIDGADDLAANIRRWQKSLWKFNAIGHIGRQGGPESWLESVEIASPRFRGSLDKLPADASGNVTIFLSAQDAGDGSNGDYVVWKNPRLEGGGLPPLPVRDIASLEERLEARRREVLEKTTDYLEVAATIGALDKPGDADLSELAKKHALDTSLLESWVTLLDLGDPSAVEITGHYTETLKANNWDFVVGWGTHSTPSVMANPTDRSVRIPGLARPHGVIAHPSPTLFSAIAWQSPIDGTIRIEARISDAHPECGNGFEWFLQHRSGHKVGTLWQGDVEVRGSATMEAKTFAIRRGEVISFILGPRQGSHACDLTAMDLTISEQGGRTRTWDLGKDVSPNILKSNPLPDRLGNAAVWHFYKGPMADVQKSAKELISIPEGSLLAEWRDENDSTRKANLARRVQELLAGPAPENATSPDGVLWTQLRKLTTPRFSAALLAGLESDDRFGKHPLGDEIDSSDLVVRAPSVFEIRIPAAFAKNRKFIVDAHLDPTHGREGTVQLEVTRSRPATGSLRANLPIVAVPGSESTTRVARASKEFRDLFPVTLCYERIVPVDEVVTLTLFYREDRNLKELILDDEQIAELDRRWDELYFVSHEPFGIVNAYEQITQFATQDRPDLVIAFKPMEAPIRKRAADFRGTLERAEPTHVDTIVDFAAKAWRRALSVTEKDNLRELYRKLRASELEHDAAARLLIARVLTSPQFLYRLEEPKPGTKATRVSSLELANRLSYFLWSSMPDAELQSAAESGKLASDEATLLAQTRRLLAHPRARRLATHFACQWLHVRDYDQNDDKNLELYPEFAKLRGSMYEETVRFFEDLFRNDGSVLDILDADHAFLDESLAKHYGIDGLTGETWRRVDGIRAKGRGGLLGMATILASQSGASRTSPILRGNWVSETLLGERLPRPPPDVPQLPDKVPSGLTARELIEKHSSDPACAKCHARIDPYGFALEQFDAIGRTRPAKVDTKTTLVDGKAIEGLTGLKNYLLADRRSDFIGQFCRKLLGYSLGRAVQLSDRPLLEEMQSRLAANDYRFSVLVETIVMSRQFREIRGADSATEE